MWVLDLGPGKVRSVGEGRWDLLRRDQTARAGKQRDVRLQTWYVPRMSLRKVKFCVVGLVILSKRDTNMKMGREDDSVAGVVLRQILTPFHRRRSALPCRARWECGGESPPGPAETGDTSSPPR